MARTIPEWIATHDDQAIPARVKLRILDRQRPEPGALPLCPDCGQPIREGDGCEFDHEVPLIDGGRHAETNLRGKHARCHRLKTAREAQARAESRTKVKKAYGIKKSSNPIPGSRQTPWKRKLDGTTVRRG